MSLVLRYGGASAVLLVLTGILASSIGGGDLAGDPAGFAKVFCLFGAIVFAGTGFAGNLGCVARLALRWRTEKDLGRCVEEARDVVALAGVSAIGVAFALAYSLLVPMR